VAATGLDFFTVVKYIFALSPATRFVSTTTSSIYLVPVTVQSSSLGATKCETKAQKEILGQVTEVRGTSLGVLERSWG